MSTLNRIKKIARDVNGPILENWTSFVNQHSIVKHTGLSIPTENDEVFNASNIEKGEGHVKRHADKTDATPVKGDVSPENGPSVTVADDKKASAKVAAMFHALATKRGILKAKLASEENNTEAAQSLMSVNARMANVQKLGDTVKRFGGE